MLRIFFIAAAALLASALGAGAGLDLGDDLAVCRDRQSDARTRQDACERVIAGGRVTGKDLSFAYIMRGNTLFQKGDNDKAIDAYNKALELDPDNFGILNLRGWTYERKGRTILRSPTTIWRSRSARTPGSSTTIAARSTCAGPHCRARSTISTRQSG